MSIEQNIVSTQSRRT